MSFTHFLSQKPEVKTPEPAGADEKHRRSLALEKVHRIITAGVKDEKPTITESLMRRGFIRSDAEQQTHEYSRGAAARAMRIVEKLTTDSIIFIAEQVGTPRGKHDWIHSSMSGYLRFAKAAGDHADMMFRDYIYFRDLGVICDEGHAKMLMEVYDKLSVKPGQLHLTGSDWLVEFYRSVVSAATYSLHLGREREQAYSRRKLGQRRSREAEYVPCLTEKALFFFQNDPDNAGKLNQYIRDRKVRLDEVSYQHFSDYAEVPRVMSSGVL